MITLNTITKALRWVCSLDDRRGIFCSLFRGNQLLISQGVLFTDKPIGSVAETMYVWVWEDHAKIADIGCIDVVMDRKQQLSLNDILDIDLTQYGVCVATLDGKASACLLPQTLGVSDIKIAINAMKTKYHTLTWGINVYTFTTTRVLVS